MIIFGPTTIQMPEPFPFLIQFPQPPPLMMLVRRARSAQQLRGGAEGKERKKHSLWQFKNQGASVWAGVTGTSIIQCNDWRITKAIYKNRKFRAYGQGLPVAHSRTPVRNWGIIEKSLLP